MHLNKNAKFSKDTILPFSAAKEMSFFYIKTAEKTVEMTQ